MPINPGATPIEVTPEFVYRLIIKYSSGGATAPSGKKRA
jgi:hypothetical protein